MPFKAYAVLQRVFPPLQWAPQYNTEKGISDLVAGITVGLTLIPQSIAYAPLVGLSPEYGLYSSLCGGFVYALFGRTSQMHIAPGAILSLITFNYINNASFGAIPAIVLLCFIAGIMELLCGVLRLGFLVDFVSTPVVAGYTSAGAITIASSQVKSLLGLKFSADGFLEIWKNVFVHIKEIHVWDTTLSVCCCAILVLMRQLKDYGTPPTFGSKTKNEDSQNNETLKKIFWFICVSRNAIIVLLCALMAFIFETQSMKPFSLTTKVPAGLPNVSVPPFKVINGNDTFSFVDMVKEFELGIIVVPFVSILGNMAIAKSFSSGKAIDASQEMLALGLCNIVGSFFSSIPVNAAFSRAAVSNASGSKTPLTGVYTSIMVILSLTFLTPYFSYIPKATLASVIWCAVIYLIEVSIIKQLWKISKIDLIPLTITFLSCLLLGIEMGILIGVGIDLLLLLYYNARPKIKVEKVEDESLGYIKLTPTSALLFPSAQYVRELALRKNLELGQNTNFVAMDCSHIKNADFTATKCIGTWASDLQKSGKTLVLYGLNQTLANALTNVCNSKCTVISTEDDLDSILNASTLNDNSRKTIEKFLLDDSLPLSG